MSVIGKIQPQALHTVMGEAAERTAALSRREVLFRETALERCRRVVLGTAWALRPVRAKKLLPLARLWLSDLISPRPGLPDADIPPSMGEFAGIVHDLSPWILAAAYARGLFPMGHFGPLKWMSPSERCILDFEDFHISRRLRSLMRQDKYTVTFDQDFEGVIKACAGKRAGRLPLTWISPRVMRAYADFHDAGYAHSFEVWNREGELAGGGYGVAIGGVFIVESQFSRATNASKLGFSVLNWHLAKWGFAFSDNKRPTPTILQMGFRNIARAEFLARLADGLTHRGRPGRWEVEAGAKVVADWDPAGRRCEAPSGTKLASTVPAGAA
jgi:leucyl/phenylalanyl-tRNA--protein transferase